MKQRIMTSIVALMLLMGLPLTIDAANTKKSTAQVKEAVTITENWDYVVTGATPFADEGSVDIVNTDHAVLILERVKPSEAIKLLAKYVKINGEKAINNSNCQVKLYGGKCGSIILPYDKAIKPLTVYSELDFGGEAVNNFGMGNSGGYMNTLTAAQLNNKIRSFKLKRGYMVTFSTQAGGRGYSRCFIAANSDLEIAQLPLVLDQKISSYRIFKWYDAGKKQLANSAGDKNALVALNVQSTYDWGQGNTSLQPDIEWVPNHIYEDWPSSSTIGGTSQSPHTKNNNEPKNSADDHPQDLKTILDNWENMMRTGLRLCSPASWDGSDYWNATGFLADFMDSIDARGWRCDIIDLHCYWPEGNFGNIANWANKYKRPVWISEWCWGASWSSNGAFASGVTEAQVKNALQSICTKLNGYDYVERYYYWNGERDPSRLYKNGKLTPAGEYYAGMSTGLAYNGKYDFVPTTPRQYGPSKFKVTASGSTATITWYDSNGEYNQLMELQRKVEGGQWTTLAVIDQKETASAYTYKDSESSEGALYRIHLVDINGREYFTNDDIETGDAIVTEDGRTLYVGGNLIANGDFDFGTDGWTSGTGATVGQPFFEVVPAGGYAGGAYLQAYGNGAVTTASALRTVFDIEAGADYYFRAASCNGGSAQNVSLSTDGKAESKVVFKLQNSDTWLLQSAVFNSGTYSKLFIGFRQLGAKAQFDKMELRRLFNSYEEAIADGAVTDQPYQAALQKHEAAVAQQEQEAKAVIDAALKAMKFPLSADQYAELTLISSTKSPKQPNLKAETGWNVKAGTYKGGDQRLNTVGGKTCWNAWWSGVNASTGTKNTMEINQDVTELPEGLYVMECKATTQHYCISDQHGFAVSDGVTVETPTLQADYFDLPVSNIWETLVTAPVYVKDNGTLTVGFKSSKQGAIDNAWREIGNTSSTGDKREGWWCATEFKLRYLPAITATTSADGWGTVCLPRDVLKPEGVVFYSVAGITTDHSKLCLEEVAEPAKAYPYIYFTAKENPRFFMTGTTLPSAFDGANNLHGYLDAKDATAPEGSYMLVDGIWQRVDNAQTAVPSNSALITTLEGLPELSDWTGATMPIKGGADAIQGIAADGRQTTGYTLDGRRADRSRGVIIERDGRQTRKVLKR